MRAKTPEPSRFVVWREADFEYGIESKAGQDQAPYCAWRDGDKIKEIHSASNDELFIELARINRPAARQLFETGIALDKPKQTIVALAKAGVIRADNYGTPNKLLLGVSRNVILGKFDPMDGWLNHYGWMPDPKGNFNTFVFRGN